MYNNFVQSPPPPVFVYLAGLHSLFAKKIVRQIIQVAHAESTRKASNEGTGCHDSIPRRSEPLRNTIHPSKIEWDRIPTDTPKGGKLELWDSQVFTGPFSGSCWRFLGNPLHFGSSSSFWVKGQTSQKKKNKTGKTNLAPSPEFVSEGILNLLLAENIVDTGIEDGERNSLKPTMEAPPKSLGDLWTNMSLHYSLDWKTVSCIAQFWRNSNIRIITNIKKYAYVK